MARKPGTKDYRDLKRAGEEAPERDTAAGPGRRWWTMTGADCAQSITSAVQTLQQNQTGRMRQQVVSARLYGNLTMMGSSGQAYARLLSSASAVKDRVTYNAIQSIIDTLTSRIGETKPRPYYLTSGGNYRQQRKAKKLNQFTDGVFYETQTYDKGLKCFRDAAIWGDGFMHVFGRAGKLVHERVLGSELWVDEIEAMYGFPRRMYRIKDVDRDEAASYFDSAEDKRTIMTAAKSPESESIKGGNSLADMVQLVECWNLATQNEDGDMVGGKHAIAVVGAKGKGGGLLLEPEDWPYDFFPFARIPWCERPVGYWSQGLCEQLQGEQLELNKELFFIQRSMHLAGTVKVLLKAGSKIVKEHINNDIGAMVTYAGDAPPVFFCPEPIHPVYFENVNRIIERMYRQAGASELSASSKKPAGLNSGKAIREYEDIESERHRTTSRYNDNFYLAIAALDVCFARELRGYQVRVPGKGAFDTIDFKRDIGSIDDDEFVRQCFPVSRLPRDPAGRLQTITEYIQAGFLTQRQGRRALDFPDLDTIESLANAQEDILTKTLDDIIDEGEYRPPEPTDDLQLAKEMVVEYIQRYRLLGLEDEKLNLLRKYNSQVATMMKKAAAAMAPPPGAPGAPQAVPAPPPVSELLPNAPQVAA